MEFEIDVSGMDLLSKNYTICVASKDGSIIRGFKFNSHLVNILASRFYQGLYQYKKSVKGNVIFKIRIYSIIVFFTFKSIKANSISLNVCKDFYGRENEIKDNLDYFLGQLLKLNILELKFGKLEKTSFADTYAYLMSKDNKNKMKTYIQISLDDIEEFLLK